LYTSVRPYRVIWFGDLGTTLLDKTLPAVCNFRQALSLAMHLQGAATHGVLIDANDCWAADLPVKDWTPLDPDEEWSSPMPRLVTRDEFDRACNAVWSEIEYQNTLPRRTDDEAKDVPGFLTLLRRYTRRTEDAWADLPAEELSEHGPQVREALGGMRKLAAICVRAMIYNGIRFRLDPPR
jgi:hypothetical protein